MALNPAYAQQGTRVLPFCVGYCYVQGDKVNSIVGFDGSTVEQYVLAEGEWGQLSLPVCAAERPLYARVARGRRLWIRLRRPLEHQPAERAKALLSLPRRQLRNDRPSAQPHQRWSRPRFGELVPVLSECDATALPERDGLLFLPSHDRDERRGHEPDRHLPNAALPRVRWQTATSPTTASRPTPHGR